RPESIRIVEPKRRKRILVLRYVCLTATELQVHSKRLVASLGGVGVGNEVIVAPAHATEHADGKIMPYIVKTSEIANQVRPSDVAEIRNEEVRLARGHFCEQPALDNINVRALDFEIPVST